MKLAVAVAVAWCTCSLLSVAPRGAAEVVAVVDDDPQDAAEPSPPEAERASASDVGGTSPASPDEATPSSPDEASPSSPNEATPSSPDEASPSSPDEPSAPAASRTAVEWFKQGVDAYLSEDWPSCVAALENAIAEWNFYRRGNVHCRLRCAAEARAATPLFPDDIEHLRHAEELVRATLCIVRCKRRVLHGHATTDAMNAVQRQAFRDLKPYEYLQLCYFKVSEFQKAASTVFTTLSKDPSNDIMKLNLKFYLSMSEVDEKKLVNYESEQYVSLFHAGTNAYFLENYEMAVTNFEASLKEFFKANDECRADCEGPFDQGWLPDFTSSVANHFAFCLKCKNGCYSKLIQLNGEKQDDFLPLHYNYLQYAYYKIGKLNEACAAAATYLLFDPADETMLENVKYYESLPQVDASMFQPHSDAIYFIKRQSYEEALLKYIADEFVFEDTLETNQLPLSKEIHKERSKSQLREPHQNDYLSKGQVNDTSHKSTSFEVLSQAEQDLTHLTQARKQGMKNGSKQQSLLSWNNQCSKQESNLLKHEVLEKFAGLERSIRNSMVNFRGEHSLGGVNRFVVDGIASKVECQQMRWFAKAGGVKGDGYEGNISPHSPLEKFEGVTLGHAALMVYFKLMDLSALHLFLNLSERGKNVIAAYFNIPSNNLHFSFTHLVCRTAMPEKFINNFPFSHQIHADNCWLLRNGSCVRADPAYHWRDYSALLYLNDDFEGGEFIFSADESGTLIESSIKPTCGRFVGFSAGRENLHGVRGVGKGSRCALALWFTLDSNHAEWGRTLTEEIIDHIESDKCPGKGLLEDLQSLERFDFKKAQTQVQQTKSHAGCEKESFNFSTQTGYDKGQSFLIKSNSTTDTQGG